MATVKAVVRTTRKNVEVNIRFRVSDGRNIQLFHNSEIKVSVDLWDAKNDCIKKRALCADEKRNSINKAVNDRKNLLIAIYDANKNKKLTSETFERLIDENFNPDRYKAVSNNLFDKIDCYIEKRKISEGRRKGIKEMKRALQRYEIFTQHMNDSSFRLDFDTIDKERVEDLHSFFKNEKSLYEDYPSVYKEIKSKLLFTKRIINKSDSTMFHLFSCFRSFYNWCTRNEICDENPFLHYAGLSIPKYCTPYYISLEERNRIADFDLSAYPLLEKQRDIFVFQCLVGCRVADLMRMTDRNIINEAIEYIPNKTKEGHPTVVRVPLNERAKKIIDKYKDVDCKGKILPFKALWLYNRDIRKVFEICGITRLVTVINSASGEEEKKPISEVASSHMARRCFIGNLYKKVKDPNLIGALSGHVEGSKAFARYREIDEDMKKEVVSLLE